MDDAEREQLYREAMQARRAGEVCPLCGQHHGALTPCSVNIPPVTTDTGGLPPQVRTSDVETSHEAAATDKRAIRFKCLGLYYDAGTAGLVDDDLAKLAGYPDGHESYRRRGSDLRALGWTQWLMTGESHGEKPLKRRTSLGANARVSVITPLGRSVWETYRPSR
jgi:hypothetical protein